MADGVVTTFAQLMKLMGVPAFTCGNVTVHVDDRGVPAKWEIHQTGKIPVDKGTQTSA